MNEKLKYIPIWLIALAHLPKLVTEYSRLWHFEHYQFFPFALGAFAWMVATRKENSVFEWSVTSTALLALDLILLTASYCLDSPWLACAGAICLCCSVCLAMKDADANTSLLYLTLLPLITLRAPLALDTSAIQWLQSATTHVASDVLNHFGYLHLREGNVLEFPGKRFLVEEACSGVQSLFTVLFLAALIVCGNRRPWPHSILLLLSAFCFAGLMNVIRVATISLAWSGYDLDLSTGWQHDAVGYACLILAALLVFSTDAFLNLVCSPVPDIPAGGASSTFMNPLISAWNWLFLVRNRERSEEKNAVNDEETEAMSQRPLPGFTDLVVPRHAFSWLWNFTESWFLSRQTQLLLTSVPFLIAGLGGAGFMCWLQSAPDGQLVEMYEQAAKEARRAGDAEGKSVYLQSLSRLRPANLQYRFDLAMHLLQNEQPRKALGQIELLTQAGLNNFAPAHVWLAQQAVSPKPLVPLSESQVEGQLIIALRLQPKNVMAKQLLADVLVKKGQLKAAETHLLDAVDQNPQLLLPLAKLQKRLHRSDDQILFHLTAATEFYEQILMDDPRNVQTRIHLAESLLLADRTGDAERVLVEGGSYTAASGDSSELRSASALFYSQLAARKMKQSIHNREQCGELIEKGLRIAPESQIVLSQALTMMGMGVTVDLDCLQPSIEVLQNAESPSQDDQLLLIRALSVSNQFDKAIVRLQPMLEEQPALTLAYARLLKAAGRTEEFDKLSKQLLSQSDSENADATTIVDSKLDAVELLSIASRIPESLTLLSSVEQDVQNLPAQLQRWKFLFSRSALANYDSKLAVDEFGSAEEALSVLHQVLATGVSSVSVLERLVKLSLAGGEFSKPAEEALNEVLVNGTANAQIYNMIGSKALELNQVPLARRYLERAYNMTRTNPMVLNNLALVLVRDEPRDPDRALRLTNDALDLIPSHPDVLSTRAEVYIAMERWEDARSDLETSLPQRSDSISCHSLLAQVCEELGDASLAEAHRRRAAELTGESRKPASGS